MIKEAGFRKNSEIGQQERTIIWPPEKPLQPFLQEIAKLIAEPAGHMIASCQGRLNLGQKQLGIIATAALQTADRVQKEERGRVLRVGFYRIQKDKLLPFGQNHE